MENTVDNYRGVPWFNEKIVDFDPDDGIKLSASYSPNYVQQDYDFYHMANNNPYAGPISSSRPVYSIYTPNSMPVQVWPQNQTLPRVNAQDSSGLSFTRHQQLGELNSPNYYAFKKF